MILSIRVVMVKSKQVALLQANPAQTAARRKELVKALYFAVGPCLIQLPIATQLALLQYQKALQASGEVAY
ncbi:hypothetical protein AAVH_31186 [Aphelenchoides avenae]|nr:hypothetical protein AAVH_31186 [Aphelenchus avenae]